MTDEEAKRKFCPVKPSGTHPYCDGSMCMWWNDKKGRCGVIK